MIVLISSILYIGYIHQKLLYIRTITKTRSCKKKNNEHQKMPNVEANAFISFRRAGVREMFNNE